MFEGDIMHYCWLNNYLDYFGCCRWWTGSGKEEYRRGVVGSKRGDIKEGRMFLQNHEVVLDAFFLLFIICKL